MRTVSAWLCEKLRELHHRSLGILCISKSTSCCSDINQWRNCQIIHKYCTEIPNMEKCNVTPIEGTDMENCSKTIENCSDGIHMSDHVPDEMTLKKNDPGDSQGQGDCNLHKGKVFVGNISFRVRRHRLWGFFEKFGKVDGMYLARDNARKGGAHKGYGFVTFKREEDATKVLNAADEELVLDNRQLRVAPVERKQLPKVSLPMRLVTGSVSEAEKSEVSAAADKSDDKLARHKLQHDVDVGKADAMSRDNTPEVVTSAAAMESLTLEEESVPGNGLIMILNDDILLNIFSYLSIKDRIIIERVCKRWRLVVLRSWQSLESLSFENLFGGFTHLGALTDYILSSVLKRGCQELRSLDLSASPHFLTDWSINKIGKRCRNLLQLNLSGVKINNFDLRTLASQCTKLQMVKLSRCFDVGEKGVWWLFKHCTSLVYVDLSENIRITGQCFHILNSNCKTVVLKGCTKFGEVGVQQLAVKCQKLTHLDISNCSTITSAAVNMITKNCKDLKTLLMSGFYKEVDAISLAAIGQLHGLETLKLSDNHVTNDSVLVAVSRGCKKLRSLDVERCFEGVTDIGIESLSGCPALQHLNISYLDKVGDSSLQRLAIEGQLRNVVARACLEMTDDSMKILALHCPHLEQLDISGCDRITDEGIIAFQEQNEDRKSSLIITAGGTQVTKDCLELFKNTNIEVNLQNMAVAGRYPNYDMMIGMPSWSDEEEEEEENERGNHGDGMMWTTDCGMVVWSQNTEDFFEADDPSDLDLIS